MVTTGSQGKKGVMERVSGTVNMAEGPGQQTEPVPEARIWER